MELRHLRYFVAVAEELHFRRAAHRLQVAQPALSLQIRDLETELGTPLFVRSSRKVELTECGRIFLEESRAILDQVTLAVGRVRSLRPPRKGTLRIGVTVCARMTVLPLLIREFALHRPEVDVHYADLTSSAQVLALQKGDIDAGLIDLPLHAPGLLVHALLESRKVMMVPLAHPLAGALQAALGDFREDRFILFPKFEASPSQASHSDQCAVQGFVPRTIIQAGDLQTTINMVATGAGVCIVPSEVQKVRRDDVTCVPLGPEAGLWETGLAVQEKTHSPILQDFIDQCRLACKNERKARKSTLRPRSPSDFRYVNTAESPPA